MWREEDMKTQGRRPRDKESRDFSAGSTNQGMLKFHSKHQKVEDQGSIHSQSLWGDHGPTESWILDL